jgi:hypothetical protein
LVDNNKLTIYNPPRNPEDKRGVAIVTSIVRIRVVREYEADDLPTWLIKAAEESGKSIAAICREAEITTQYWYDLIKDKKPIRLDTLEKIEAAVGKVYSAAWREFERSLSSKAERESSSG